MVANPNNTCLGLEYFCFEGDELWTMPDQNLIDLGTRELETLGFIRASDVDDGAVVRMPKAYPVYDSDYKEALTEVREYLNDFNNLQLVGRNGLHRYNNQDHSMLTAMLAAENILGANHNLWEVNAEQEYHEEILDQEDLRESDRAVIRAFARFDKWSLAISTGTICGLVVFLATLWLTLTGDVNATQLLQILNQYFIGYTVTLKGAFIAMGYTFLWSFLFGWLFAYLHNVLIAFFFYRVKRKIELREFRDFI